MKDIDFKWTDSTVKEFVAMFDFAVADLSKYIDRNMEAFKESKEVKGVDWEILELTGDDNIIISRDSYCPVIYTFDMLYQRGLYPIRTVKRLSDNEVFSVGDCVDYVHGNFTIEKFEIKPAYGMDRQIWVYGGIVTITSHPEHGEFKNIRKPLQRTPLFRTEDGVDIFEGDRWWSVWLHDGSYDITFTDTINKYDPDFKGKRFSTEEKAEEFVILNKPCLMSLNEVLGLIPQPNWHTIELLMGLVKQKLDKQ